mgnify:FL=1
MSEDYRRALADGLRVFESGEYGVHILNEINSLVEGQKSFLLHAPSWETYQTAKAKLEAFQRVRQIILLETNVE